MSRALLLWLLAPLALAQTDGVLDAITSRDWQGAPGLVYSVSLGGKVVAEEAHGLASLELEVPLTPDSVLNAGSVAKLFTAYAVLRLQEAGRLELDDAVQRHVELPRYAADISLRQLLQHTSGLKDYWSLAALGGLHPGDRHTQAAALALIRRQPGLNFPPGTRHLYSNSGYVLLAEVIAGTSGKAYSQWLQETLFGPLALRDTRMLDDPFSVVPRLAPSYRRLGDEPPESGLFRREPLNSGVTGSGNLLSTAPELRQLGEYLLRARIDGRPVLELMSQQAELPGQAASGYGLGVSLGQLGPYQTFHHGGANAGYRAHLLLLPEIDLVVATLANGGHLRAAAVAEALAKQALQAAGLLPAATRAAATSAPPLPAIGHAPYAGMYLLENGLPLRLREVGGQLVMLLSGSPHALQWAGEHRYELADGQGLLVFAMDRRGQVQELSLEIPGLMLGGERTTVARLGTRQLQEYAGEYFSPALAAAATLAVDQSGRLHLQQPSGGRLLLRPLRPDLFLEWDTADFIVAFRRDRRGRISGFDVSLERALQVEFSKR